MIILPCLIRCSSVTSAISCPYINKKKNKCMKRIGARNPNISNEITERYGLMAGTSAPHS
jgi:hypothetical protein